VCVQLFKKRIDDRLGKKQILASMLLIDYDVFEKIREFIFYIYDAGFEIYNHPIEGQGKLS
jgi:hypothetical protein